jgi:hypothetical protein
MTALENWGIQMDNGTTDTLYGRLRSLERRGAAGADFQRMIEDFFQREPAVKTAMPQFSTFGLLEAVRSARESAATVTVGRYSVPLETAVRVLQRLTPEDASRSYSWLNPNSPFFALFAAAGGGLFFALATPEAARNSVVPIALAGSACCFVIAGCLRLFFRNSTKRTERPQWVCALHVDRYLQAAHRGTLSEGLRVDDLPRPLFRRKGPFYDLHNQIMAGSAWVYRSSLTETPALAFENNRSSNDAR